VRFKGAGMSEDVADESKRTCIEGTQALNMRLYATKFSAKCRKSGRFELGTRMLTQLYQICTRPWYQSPINATECIVFHHSATQAPLLQR
jgi:hypothetical protein